MFPRECAGPLGGKLVVERHGIVVVQENEVLADWQIEPRADDQAVLNRARDGTNVHHIIRANEVFGLYVCVHVCFCLFKNLQRQLPRDQFLSSSKDAMADPKPIRLRRRPRPED